MRVSEVIRNGDRDPDVTHVDGGETHFILIPDPPELLDEDEFAEGMIQLVHVARGMIGMGTDLMDMRIPICFI
jgi:hypothetical protein